MISAENHPQRQPDDHASSGCFVSGSSIKTAVRTALNTLRPAQRPHNVRIR
jgi:hypothetical protein